MHTKIQVLSYTPLVVLLIGAGLLFASFVPFVASAAGEPNCSLAAFASNGQSVFGTNGSISLGENDWLIVAWGTAGATTVRDLNNNQINTTGFVIVTPESNINYEYRAINAMGSATCSLSVTVPGSTVEEDETPAESDGILAVTTVPLLWGGNAKANASIPISYLQLKNTGTETAHVSGFRVTQNGSATAGNVITRLTTVDDKGGSRGASETDPFGSDDSAFAPTDASIAPGSLKLFTIKAELDSTLMPHLFQNLKIDVIGVETNGSVQASFPLRGTTWTLTL